MIINARERNLLANPVSPSMHCPVLEYADDTLIIIKADPNVASHLKRIMDDFSLATRLSINFAKTTVVPINVDPEAATAMASSLGAVIAAFPKNTRASHSPLSFPTDH